MAVKTCRGFWVYGSRTGESSQLGQGVKGHQQSEVGRSPLGGRVWRVSKESGKTVLEGILGDRQREKKCKHAKLLLELNAASFIK